MESFKVAYGDSRQAKKWRNATITWEELRSRLAPEFINRIDDIVRFEPLGPDAIRVICSKQLDALKARLASNGTAISFDGSVLDLLAEKGYQPRYGARPVKRAVNDHIINPLTMALLDGIVTKDSPIIVSADGDDVIFKNVREEPVR